MPGTYISPAETGFYYLTSRYYDPEIGRFINADRQLNNDILGNNLFSYCSNNPITRSDDSGQGWWVVAGALVGGIVGVATKMASNIVTGNEWNDGVIGAFVGGAVAGAVVAATGGTALAASGGLLGAFAGAGTEILTNEVASYIPSVSNLNGQSTTKKVTKDNVKNSVTTIVGDTIVNGTASAITGGIAGKSVPTNCYWIKPQKFSSSFVGKYAIKSELQSLTQGILDFCYNGLDYINSLFSSQKQRPTVVLYPET